MVTTVITEHWIQSNIVKKYILIVIDSQQTNHVRRLASGDIDIYADKLQSGAEINKTKTRHAVTLSPAGTETNNLLKTASFTIQHWLS